MIYIERNAYLSQTVILLTVCEVRASSVKIIKIMILFTNLNLYRKILKAKFIIGKLMSTQKYETQRI